MKIQTSLFFKLDDFGAKIQIWRIILAPLVEIYFWQGFHNKMCVWPDCCVQHSFNPGFDHKKDIKGYSPRSPASNFLLLEKMF